MLKLCCAMNNAKYFDKGGIFLHIPPQATAIYIPDPPKKFKFPGTKLCIITKAYELLKTRDLNVESVQENVNQLLVPHLHKEQTTIVAGDKQVNCCQFMRDLFLMRHNG